MADKSVDIILNCLDQTGPAVDSAIGNMQRFAEGAEQASQQAASGGGGLSDIGSTIAGTVAGLFSVSGILTVAAGAATAFGVAMVTNAGGLRDRFLPVMSEVWSNLKTTAAAAFTAIVESLRGLGGTIADAMAGIVAGIGETISSIIGGTFEWGTAFEGVVRALMRGFAIVEFGFMNWRDVGGLVIAQMILALTKYGDNAFHLFGTVMPKLLRKSIEDWQGAKAAFVLTLDAIQDALGMGEQTKPGLQQARRNRDEKTALQAQSFFKDLPKDFFTAPQSEMQKTWQATVDQMAKDMRLSLDEHLKMRDAQVPGIMSAATSLFQGMVKFASEFGSDWLRSLFSGQKSPPVMMLPGLNSERFTTGVKESAQNEAAMQTAMIRRQAEELKALNTFMQNQLPTKITQGIKAAGSFGGVFLPGF